MSHLPWMDKLMQNFQFKTSYLAHIVTIGIATFLIYSNTYAVPFYFDDITSIINSAQTYQGDLSDIYNQFGNRFVAYASFQLNYKLDGLNLWGFHLTNIIVHLLASLSVYLLALQLFIITSRIQKQDPINKDIQYIFAFITALLFAVHPLQIQAVAYIVQRTTALAALFYISTMVSYIQFRTSKSALIKVLMIVLTLLFLLLAFYTKQNTYTLPGALVLIEFIFIYQLSERNYKDLLKPGIFFVVFCVLGLIYVLLFKQTIITLLFAGSRETPDFSRIVYFETQLGVLALYLKLYLLPIGQQFEYVYPLEDGKLINSLGYILSYIALIGFAFWQIKRNAILAFAIIFYFLAHIIESAVIPISDIVFEHRTYLPNLGLSLIVAFLLLKLSKINSTLSIVSVALVITALSILTYQRNAIWANPERLYKAELAINNNKPRIHGVLGKYYKEQKQYEEAVNSYKIAFELSGNVRDIDNQGFLKKFSYLNNYATNLVRAGKVDEAILVIKQFLPEVKNKKHLARIYSNLGIFYSLKNNYYQCIQSLSKSIELDNKMVEPILFSGKCYARLGNKEMATKMFNRALTLSPDSSRVKAIMKSVGY